jgi:hypothetical protein
MKVRACGEYPHLSVLTVTFEVFLSAIAGYVPSAMVRCIAAFMDACYIARRNAIDSSSLEHFQDCVRTYHDLCTIFLEAGLNIKLSVPRQHALSHFYQGIHLFGSPNGLCSSITESKHIEAVKKTWRRSSRYRALTQMLRTIQHMDKMQALQRRFEANGMLRGFGFSPDFGNMMDHDTDTILMDDSEEHEDEDEAVVSGESKDVSEFDVQLAARNRAYCPHISKVPHHSIFNLAECGYPSQLHALAAHIKQPEFPLAFSQFLYKCCNPEAQIAPSTLQECPAFDGAIKVYHSAIATFYAPSDLSGSGGLRRERIRSAPCFYGHPRRDTVFVVTDDSQPGMEGMEIGRVQLFFSFQYRRKEFSCALINWFIHADERDPDTGMWTVTQECDEFRHLCCRGGFSSQQYILYFRTQPGLKPNARKDALVGLTQHEGFRSAHPREDHLVPIYIAAGAGEDGGAHVLSGLYGCQTVAFGV